MPDVTLDAIAERAGVTLQTVLRKFGSKDALFEIAAEERAGSVMAERKPAAPDPRSAVVAIVASYEQMGAMNWRMLRNEDSYPVLAKLLARARGMHRDWIEQSFAAVLPARGAARARCIDALFTALDFYVWKLHRKDLGLTRAQTEALMVGLVDAIIEEQR